MKTICALLLLISLLAMAGCGGSGGAVLANPFAGAYRSTVTLDGGKSGVLDMSVASSGALTGTLTVSAPAVLRPGRAPSDFSFSIGTITISGSVTQSGTFNVQATDADSGLFSISGVLVGSGGNLTISAGTQTFDATISSNVGGGGGGGSITFSSVDANISGAAFGNNPFVLISNVGGYMAIVCSPSATEVNRAFTLTLTPDDVAGTILALDSAHTIVYTEDQKGFLSTSGSIKVVARSGNSVTVQLDDVLFVSESGGTGSGTFKVNGTIVK